MQTLTAVIEENRSVSGKRWQIKVVDTRCVTDLMQKFSLPELLARVLAGKGGTASEVASFLNPTIKQLLPDPFHFLDMQKAAERLVHAIITGESVAVFGDYDVDGATSSALLARYFQRLGRDLTIYIPDRIKEGYGPNALALSRLKAQGIDVCMTVDCGSLAFDALSQAHDVGLDVIVLDHHLGGESLPKAVAVVNPNRLDETSDQRHLAAVGVTFLFLVAVTSLLDKQGFFRQVEKPDLMSFLDLVALGTVCDVVPLTGINRAFVAQGLKVMRMRCNIGMAALMDVANVTEVATAYHCGFVLGPRVNAGGRVGQSHLGATLLSTEDRQLAFDIARQLDLYNKERQAIEEMMLEEAIIQAEQHDTQGPLICVQSQGWHPGVIGIIASRLKERYHRPVAVIALENGIGKASARSIPGVDFGAAVIAANQSGLLIAGGGHAMAAGFTVAQEKIPQLQTFLAERFTPYVQEYGVSVMTAIGYCSIRGVTVELAKMLQRLEPYGTANAEPRFIFSQVIIMKVEVVGKDHLRVILADGDGVGGKGMTMRAMAFRCLETPMGVLLRNSVGRRLFILGKIRLNVWQGIEKADLLIDDIMV